MNAQDDFIYTRDQHVLDVPKLEAALDRASAGLERAAWCRELDRTERKNRFFI
ncbi:hypothetical protein [Arthrobacter sp. StoSoilB13]|uniref:hypothetical protein n=1 Tax=Arthrobacter sp. StoSoilB13 TaxID=2830993 RepID=UPI001CC440B9|nr:hypothetical protein [Arthrobacter sp. StoSoilB13]